MCGTWEASPPPLVFGCQGYPIQFLLPAKVDPVPILSSSRTTTEPRDDKLTMAELPAL
jgi:hypothetical protein